MTIGQQDSTAQDRTGYLAEFFADYSPGVDRFKDRYLADFLEDFIAAKTATLSVSDRLPALPRPTPLVTLPPNQWAKTSCAASPAQAHETAKKLQQLPSHKNKSKQCPTCAVDEVQKILDHAWIEFGRYPVMFKTEVPNRAEAAKIKERLRNWAQPGDRVVIRRQDTERILILSSISLSKAKGLDKYPSVQITNAHALLLLREALALPGLAVRAAVTWVGPWAPPRPATPVGTAQRRKGWLNVHKNINGAKRRVGYIVGTKDPDLTVTFDEDSGTYVDVLVSDETWRYVIDVLRDPGRLDAQGWDYAPTSAATTGGTAASGLPVVPADDRQPDPVFVKPVTPQALPPSNEVVNVMVNDPLIGHTETTGHALQVAGDRPDQQHGEGADDGARPARH